MCGLDLRGAAGGAVWWSPTADGVTCEDDRGGGSVRLSGEAVGAVVRAFRVGVAEFLGEEMERARVMELLRFGVGLLERHTGRRLRSATVLGR